MKKAGLYLVLAFTLNFIGNMLWFLGFGIHWKKITQYFQKKATNQQEHVLEKLLENSKKSLQIIERLLFPKASKY